MHSFLLVFAVTSHRNSKTAVKSVSVNFSWRLHQENNSRILMIITILSSLSCAFLSRSLVQKGLQIFLAKYVKLFQ